MSQDDIIHLEKNIPLDVGDEIQLEKVVIFILFVFTMFQGFTFRFCSLAVPILP